MKQLIQIASASLLILFSASVLAHGKLVAKHGGVVSAAHDVMYELVAAPDGITVHIDDHGEKVDTAGASGKLILLKGKNKTELVLTPAGDNKLEAKGAPAVAAGTKAVLAVSLAGKAVVSVRFVVK
jgi:hypothetical protein